MRAARYTCHRIDDVACRTELCGKFACGRLVQADPIVKVPLGRTSEIRCHLAGGERLPQHFGYGYGHVRHRIPPSRACWMNRLSAIARRSSLPKRTDRPCADAYCSAARAASMLAVSAARNAVSAVLELAVALAGLPFPFPLPLPLPFALLRAPLLPFTGRPDVSACAGVPCATAAEPLGCTTQSINRQLPSRRSARQMANGSFGRMPSSTSLSRTIGGTAS